MTAESTATLGGLRTTITGSDETARLYVVVLHGHAMTPADLVPFSHSLGVPARFFFPEGPLDAAPAAGRAWWPIDQERRAAQIAIGPRDLAAEHPPGVAAARAQLVALLAEVRAAAGARPLALVGFSQGGMLCCDTLLRTDTRVDALALLSSSRIAADEWTPLAHRLRGLPALVSHGERDADLAFAAGEALRDLLTAGGATVTWVPFETGHEIPLVVWRALRKFLMTIV